MFGFSHFLIAVLLAAPTSGDTIDSLYASVLDSIGTQSPKQSIEAVKQVLALNRSYAPAYGTLARLYLEQNTPESRINAEVAIKRAIQLDRDNPKYQLTMGDIFWSKGQWNRAADYLDKVLEQYPDAAHAAYRIGNYAVKEFLAAQDRLECRGSVYIPFTHWAEQHHTKAIHLLERAIELAPDTREAYYQLGVLHQESRNPAGLLDVAERFLVLDPDDSDATMFAALAHQTLGDFAKADSLYTRALALVDDDQRRILESVDLLTTADQALAMVSPTSSSEWEDTPERARFWRKQDPLFLSPFNERRMAHYGRVAYANLRFRKHSTGEDGWRTDMGRSWIKFGRFRNRRTTMRTETWHYETFSLSFADFTGLDDWSFASTTLLDDPFARRAASSGSRFTNRPQSIEEFFRRPERPQFIGNPPPESPHVVFKKTRPRYVDPYASRRYTLPHQVVAFQRDDSVRIDVSYAIPRDRLKTSENAFLITEGEFLFDASWDPQYRKTRQVTIPAQEPALHEGAKAIRAGHLTAERSHKLRVAPQHVAVEVLDEVGLKVGTFRQDRTYAFTDSLDMSDILLATDIRPLSNTVGSRDDLRIRANPLRTFDKTELVHVCVEFYNLIRDAFGQTKYGLTYVVERVDGKVPAALFQAIDVEGESSLTLEPDRLNSDAPLRAVFKSRDADQFVTSPRTRGKAARTVRVSIDHTGGHIDDVTYFAIDVAQLPIGIYRITVQIADQAANAVVSRDTLFRIVDP